jgi:meso-butanediol dehydrogenase / (S,S)-butanediol dehydrogenase / diacetyl reductase
MSNLEGKGIVITGAASGIGAAIARALASDGACVTLADVSEEAHTVASEIVAAGGTAIAFTADVRKRAQVRALIDASVRAHRRLDVIFNNAGICQARPFLDITEEDWRLVTDVNALGVLIGMQEAIRTFRAQGGGGKIVNTASIAGKQGFEPFAHYCASKFGVIGLTQVAARAFGKEQITVNAFCPGVVATDMWKNIDRGFRESGLSHRENEAFDTFAAGAVLGRSSRTDDILGVARYLASSDSDFMTGQSLVVDGGMVFV